MRLSRKLIGIAAVAVVVTLVLACGVLALVPRNAPVAVAAVPPAQVEQRAMWMAENYNGTVTMMTARAITQGEVAMLRCSLFDQVQEQVTVWIDSNRHARCDNDLPLWEVTLEGNFRHPQLGNIGTLRVITAPDGNVQVVLP